MLSLDANVLVYAADSTAGPRHAAAQQLLRDSAGLNTALTEQSLFEFFHAATRKGKISVPDATTIVRELLQNFILLLPHRTALEDALMLLSQYPLSIWDARLLAVCEAHGYSCLLSEDMQDGARYGSVTVLNPFNPANAAAIAQVLNP